MEVMEVMEVIMMAAVVPDTARSSKGAPRYRRRLRFLASAVLCPLQGLTEVRLSQASATDMVEDTARGRLDEEDVDIKEDDLTDGAAHDCGAQVMVMMVW